MFQKEGEKNTTETRIEKLGRKEVEKQRDRKNKRQIKSDRHSEIETTETKIDI